MKQEMNESSSIYNSTRLADGYAFNRPPVHKSIIEKISLHLGLNKPVKRALDIGCGAGISTAALEPVAHRAFGIEPVRVMLKHSRALSTHSDFLTAKAEYLPFKDKSFGLIAAAGSVNYADLNLFFPGAERLLEENGAIVIYDFSAGMRLNNDKRLEEWFKMFLERYPYPPDYDLDVTEIEYSRYGLALEAFEKFEVVIPMTLDAYLRYVLSETNVEQALIDGIPEEEITGWCENRLPEIFGTGALDVIFDGYFAIIKHDKSISRNGA